MNKIEKLSTFCRRKKNQGMYTGNVNGKVLRLVDRETITPKDPIEIKFLMSDPEIEILCADEKEQKREDDRNAEKAGNVGGKVLTGQVVRK